MIAILLSTLFVMARCALLVRFFASASWVAWIFGLSEASALAFTMWGLMAGKIDRTRVGLLLPMLYTAPMLLRPQGDGFALAGVLVLSLCTLQVILRAFMGRRLSVGVAVFHDLIESGPYAFIRHPLALTECAIIFCFFLRFATLWNAVAAAVGITAAMLAVKIEERFLRNEKDYREYSERVAFRFVPGIW